MTDLWLMHFFFRFSDDSVRMTALLGAVDDLLLLASYSITIVILS